MASPDFRAALFKVLYADSGHAMNNYARTFKWWNPDRAAFYAKTTRRFDALIKALQSSADEEKVFMVYANYKGCLANRARSVIGERICYENHLQSFLLQQRQKEMAAEAAEAAEAAKAAKRKTMGPDY